MTPLLRGELPLTSTIHNMETFSSKEPRVHRPSPWADQRKAGPQERYRKVDPPIARCRTTEERQPQLASCHRRSAKRRPQAGEQKDSRGRGDGLACAVLRQAGDPVMDQWDADPKPQNEK